MAGLSEATAAERLRHEGFNELPTARPRNLAALAWNVVREPMFLLLVACGVIYLILGDTGEALMLLGFVIVVMGITLYQERKTERALTALRDLSSPRASVVRDGVQRRIAGRDVVRGDLLILREGDRVPADAALLHTTHLSVDESLLTGESVPVMKQEARDTELSTALHRPGGENTSSLFSGTLVVQGQGVAQVHTTGARTELGRIGKSLQSVMREDTLLQRETRGMVRKLATAGLLFCGLVALLYGLKRHDWLQGLLAGITLAMAVLPEEVPMVLTVFLALGARRISRQGVLTRHAPVIETLGAATVLCTDKTGTLTRNQMTVTRLMVGDAAWNIPDTSDVQIPEVFHTLVEFGILASQRDPFDPMEKAIHHVGRTWLTRTEHLHDTWELVREYPLSRQLLAISHVWRGRASTDYVIAAKGAPEAIADLCHFTPEQTRALEMRIGVLARDGLRVLGVARAQIEHPSDDQPLPGAQHDFHFEFIGLLGLADPIRPAVPHAIEECHRAGVRVVMITGDYPETARCVARQIKLPEGDLLTGAELAGMDDAALRRRIGRINVFARVMPEQKLRIVQALKDNGEIVAMTGDGVNDAPALKAAHIGIAMGERGTDVAREAAGLVLLDDAFASIVQAMRLGRHIFDNIRKAIAYTFAIHVPIAGLSLLPVLMGWPMVLLPMHILFLELIIDPACSIVFEAEPEEGDIMNRPPRNQREPLFSRRNVGFSVLQGLIVLGASLFVFGTAFSHGRNANEARALCFVTLVVANLGLILTNRSLTRSILATLHTRNIALWWVLSGAVLFLALVLYVPALMSLFQFAPLHAGDLFKCVLAALCSILMFEIIKHWKPGAHLMRNLFPR